MTKKEQAMRGRKDCEIRAQVAYFSEKNVMSKKEVAAELGMTPATFYSKLAHPENFSLGEMRNLIRLFHLTDEQVLTIV